MNTLFTHVFKECVNGMEMFHDEDIWAYKEIFVRHYIIKFPAEFLLGQKKSLPDCNPPKVK